MNHLDRYSEPYRATGGLAAAGVLNQLGRPNVEPLEVLVREAVQNCWDAKIGDKVRVDVGRFALTEETVSTYREALLPAPTGLPLHENLTAGEKVLFFADYGTHGLGGPIRADLPGEPRDFVDFVLNIGQPPDKDFAGGSFGYGKAAFYLASKARAVIIDTLCQTGSGTIERRLIGCGLGASFELAGRPFTGRHWWGRTKSGEPEPLTGDDAEIVARGLGLPPRDRRSATGTTVAVIAPGVEPLTDETADLTIPFLAEALVWNFWPRMIDTPGSTRRTLEFTLTDEGRRARIPDPRTHRRLRGFVEALDRMRYDPGPDDPLTLDRSIESRRPSRILGRLVIAKGPAAPAEALPAAATAGARATAAAVHHVVLMRIPEIVVNYLPGDPPATGQLGYSGVFRCSHDLDDVFKQSEPPAHDDWVARSIPDKTNRSYVNVALRRIHEVCREAAGYGANASTSANSAELPLGEFADTLAALMPGGDGPGARRSSPVDAAPRRHRRLGRTNEQPVQDWSDSVPRTGGGATGPSTPDPADGDLGQVSAGRATELRVDTTASARSVRPAQTRNSGNPSAQIAPDGTPVISYPFEVRSRGNQIRLEAAVEIMTNDGGQSEVEAPLGESRPHVYAWVEPTGKRHRTAALEAGPEDIDGLWHVEVALSTDAMMRVDIEVSTL